MPDLTPAHRDHARRALVASGYPIGDDVDALERIRRTELLEAVATAIALAEQRGPVPAAPPADGVEVLLLPDPAEAAVDVLGYLQARLDVGALDDVVIATHDGHELRSGALWALVLGDLDADEPGGLLETDEPQPDEVPCAHPDGYGDPDPADGYRYCRSGCGDVAVADWRAERLSWNPGDIVVTPPPDPSR